MIVVLAFAIGFHMLLRHEQLFAEPWDAALKTLIMMSGEYDYTTIFFETGKVPFPSVTYTMFVVFFLLISIMTLNLLVGLTVDDIKASLDEAENKNLTMKVTTTIYCDILQLNYSYSSSLFWEQKN